MDGLQKMAVNEKGDFIDSEGKPIDFATLGIPLAARELQRKYNVAPSRKPTSMRFRSWWRTSRHWRRVEATAKLGS